MAFTSAAELMIVLVVAFFLLGVPLMSFLVTMKERAKKRSGEGDRR